MKKLNIAVVGAGLGGLSAAISLAARGCRVDVYEQNDVAGGKAFSVEQAGYRFDAGPSLVTMPMVFDRLFASAGRRREDYLPFIKLPLVCRYFFSDAATLDDPGDIAAYAEAIGSRLQDPASAVRRFFGYAGRVYDIAGRLFLEHSPFDGCAYARPAALSALARLAQIDPFRSMAQAQRSFFNDPRTLQLFGRYATYSGSNPYQAPATLNLIPYVEHAFGAFAPEGGIVAIPRALVRLAQEAGVRFHFSSCVRAILRQGRHVNGIDVNNERLHYDAVVSNADVHTTYRQLLGDTVFPAARRYQRLEPSTSGVVFLWGVRRKFSRLDIHNIFFSSDYPREFAELFGRRVCPQEPTVYVNISCRYAPQDAPRGGENWFVLVNVPHNMGQDWGAEVRRLRAAILGTIEKRLGESVAGHIVAEQIITPADIALRHGGVSGSIYGISSNGRLAAFMRQANREAYYPGLYFCGGSSHPGGGMPLALLSGMICADLLMRFEREQGG